MSRPVAWLVASILLALVGLYCTMWALSSSSLAMIACNGDFSLFAPTFACRQPKIAAMLAITFVAGTCFCVYKWIRSLNRQYAESKRAKVID